MVCQRQCVLACKSQLIKYAELVAKPLVALNMGVFTPQKLPSTINQPFFPPPPESPFCSTPLKNMKA